MEIKLPLIAGFISTVLFAPGTLSMLTKAFRTKNMASYSLGNILMSNVGNLIYAIYVFNLPPRPIWFSHGYNLLSTGLTSRAHRVIKPLQDSCQHVVAR